MGMKIEIVRAEREHLEPIAANMRAADAQEVWAASRESPLAALEDSYQKSSFAYTGLVGGEPVGMFGVGDVNILAGVGAPWLLGTDGMMKIPKRLFLERSRLMVEGWRARYRLLSNYVDGRNTVSIRWLKWLGFEFREDVVMNGVKFYRFEMRGII